MCLSFPREIGLKRRLCSDRKQFDEYISFLKGKSSCYTSLYSFDRMRKDRYRRVDYTSAIIDRAWWDFDSGDRGSIEDVKRDVVDLVCRLDGDWRIVATGRGFHVFLMFNEKVRGREWVGHLERFQRTMAKGLTTLDGVGYPEKLVRIPMTYNPKRGRWAIPLNTQQFISDPFNFRIPRKPTSSMIEYCPFYGAEPAQDTFSLVKWVSGNPAPKRRAGGTILKASDVGDMESVPIPPCLMKSIKVENPPHHVRLALAQYLCEELRWYADPDTLTPEIKRNIEEQITSYISTLGWRDYNESRTRAGIRSAINYKQSPTCRWYQSRGMCPEPCWADDGSRF